MCDKTYTKCIAKKADCSKSIVYPANWTAVAKKVSASGKTFCPGPAGFQGTGYTSTFTTTVKNGVALDGNGPDFRPYTDGKLNFCTFQSRAQSVATGAFQGVSGCSMPSDVTYTLQKACITQKSDLPFYLTFVFNATCGGQTKNIAVMGGGYYKPKPGVDPESKWTYAIIS